MLTYYSHACSAENELPSNFYLLEVGSVPTCGSSVSFTFISGATYGSTIEKDMKLLMVSSSFLSAEIGSASSDLFLPFLSTLGVLKGSL
jgi:hypothetical protein